MENEEDLIPGIDIPARNIPELSVATVELIKNLQENCENEEQVIIEHLKTYTEDNPISKVTLKDADLEWFNVSEPLHFEEHFTSHIVVLDFFTYCCINCLHILPDLQDLEEKYIPNKSPIIVVGIHSGKFENERLTRYAADAVKRNNITHPVANDGNCKLWHDLGISCWPTLLIVGPGGFPLFVLMGEGNKTNLFKFVSESIKYFEKARPLNSKFLPLSPYLYLPSKESDLYYPGKVETCDAGLIIADSGNNRIIITNWNGEVQVVVGSGKKGISDGSFENASFNNPQGIAFLSPAIIFIADTDNHLIRKINLDKRTVETVVGIRRSSSPDEQDLPSEDSSLSSPWDLCLGRTLDVGSESPPNLLLIAVAGKHQIWGLFLTSGQWLKKSFYAEGELVCLAGSGIEENRNTSYPLKAGFAQPSGITISRIPQGEVAFIADSESSSIRQFSLFDGAVKRIAGGSVNPLDLFAYGDEVGTPQQAKFQHPLGVAAYGDRVYVADSYNHKIKLLRKENKSYVTENIEWNGSTLNEPGGICVSHDGKYLYVADTNNFCIKEYNIENGKIRQINLEFGVTRENLTEDTVDSPDKVIFYVPQRKHQTNLIISLELPANIHLNSEVQQNYHLICSENISIQEDKVSVEMETKIPVEINLSNEAGATLRISTKLILCSDKGMCFMKDCISILKFCPSIKEDTNSNLYVKLKPKL